MSLLTRPFDEISRADVDDLIARQVREGPTLDYKQALTLDDSGKLDLLGDVTAMANAAGGTLVYGAREGEGEDRGLIVGVEPMLLRPDETALAISNLLRDNVDEPIAGVRHMAIAAGDTSGGYLYIIRVPASALAPHMVTRKSGRPRFFLRGNVSNDPMTTRQIKEVAARGDVAFERATRLIASRTEVVRERDQRRREGASTAGESSTGGVFLFHAVSLFGPRGGVDFRDDALYRRFLDAPPFGMGSNSPTPQPRMTLEGLYSTIGDVPGTHGPGTGGPKQYTLLLRSGGLECCDVDVLHNRVYRGGGPRVLSAWEVEQNVLDALEVARDLTDAGVLPLPVALSLQLLDVGDATFATGTKHDRGAEGRPDGDVTIDPVVVTTWGREAERDARQMFDAVWQAWGFRQSFHYLNDGSRIVRQR